MKLDEAINHLEEVIEKDKFGCKECKEEHIELHDWLLELRELRKINMPEITRTIARNCVAWDTSKDKKEGLLPEVTITNEYLYEALTGKKYNFYEACRLFNIGES